MCAECCWTLLSWLPIDIVGSAKPSAQFVVVRSCHGLPFVSVLQTFKHTPCGGAIQDCAEEGARNLLTCASVSTAGVLVGCTLMTTICDGWLQDCIGDQGQDALQARRRWAVALAGPQLQASLQDPAPVLCTGTLLSAEDVGGGGPPLALYVTSRHYRC